MYILLRHFINDECILSPIQCTSLAMWRILQPVFSLVLDNFSSFPPGVATVVGMGLWTIKAPGYVQARGTVGYTKVSKL